MPRTTPRRTSLLLAAVVVAGARGLAAPAEPPPCDRLAVGGVLPGMTADAVRAKLGAEQMTTEIVRSDGRRVTAADYAVPGAFLRVTYDGIARGRGDARVETVRLPSPLTFDGVAELLRRAGEPAAGRDSLVQGLAAGPVVWLDERCGVALTYFRRNESWWTDEVNTFLEGASLEAARREAAPSGAIVAGLLDAGGGAAPEPKAPAPLTLAIEAVVPRDESAPPPATDPPASEAKPDVPARRTAYVPPDYPRMARRMGIRGTVTLAIVVRADGSVGETRVIGSRPAGRGFEQAARDAASRWRYAPATRAGVPVETTIDVVVEFR